MLQAIKWAAIGNWIW